MDYTVDCKVKVGDAVLQLPGCEQKIGALSTFANAYVLNSIVIEAVNMMVDDGYESAYLAQRQLRGRRRIQQPVPSTASATASAACK